MTMLPKEDPYQSRYLHPITDEDIIYSTRRRQEYLHRADLERHVSRPLILPTLTPLPHIKLEDAQDCYNKATAIYWTDCRPYPALEAQLFCGPISAMTVIYPQWFLVKGHNTDIEFGRFVAKTIKLQDTELRQQNIADVLSTHRSLCEKLVASKSEFETLKVTGKKSFSLDIEDHQYYKLRPLFRALIVFVDNPSSRRQELLVKLIRTGFTEGLSAPIDFSSINPEIRSQNEDGTVVTVPVQAAIRFVMELDERERRALPDKLDEEGQEAMRIERLEDMRIDNNEPSLGEDLTGPPSTWLDQSKLDVVVVPQTMHGIKYARQLRGGFGANSDNL
ncbi:hypothetical protein EG329_000665 [Mollisiaceae sp. DMI_Dod_QoI]|nr:hypothetical protein EG329_000665 [Helotiales sp. DMI_Dod_QoI]